MSDAPERIWADPDHWVQFPPDGLDGPENEYVEYIRADLVPAQSAADRIEALEAEKVEAHRQGYAQGKAAGDAFGASLKDHVQRLEAEVAAMRDAPAKVFHGYIREDLSREACARAYAKALEAAASTLDNHDRAPCRAPGDWQNDNYISGQQDAALSWQHAIRALPNPYSTENNT